MKCKSRGTSSPLVSVDVHAPTPSWYFFTPARWTRRFSSTPWASPARPAAGGPLRFLPTPSERRRPRPAPADRRTSSPGALSAASVTGGARRMDAYTRPSRPAIAAYVYDLSTGTARSRRSYGRGPEASGTGHCLVSSRGCSRPHPFLAERSTRTSTGQSRSPLTDSAIRPRDESLESLWRRARDRAVGSRPAGRRSSRSPAARARSWGPRAEREASNAGFVVRES